MKPGELYTGTVSWFGGPQDRGVKWTEGLALYGGADGEKYTELFLSVSDVIMVTPKNMLGNPADLGLARRLIPDALYCACRWDYSLTPRDMLRSSLVECYPVMFPQRKIVLRPVDWGPSETTGRLIDVSFGALQSMAITTDDMVCARLIAPADRGAWDVAG